MPAKPPPDPAPRADLAFLDSALTERKKELACVYAIAANLATAGQSAGSVLEAAAESLAGAMLYPHRAAVRIVLDGQTAAFGDGEMDGPRISVTRDLPPLGRLAITVGYRKAGADDECEPFLPEEREMVGRVADLLTLWADSVRAAGAADEQRSYAQELQAVLENSPGVAFIWEMQENWPVAFVSRNVSQFGYTADDFYSGRVSFSDLIHRDDLARIEAEVEDHLRCGHADYEQKYRIVRRDGAVRWVTDSTHARYNEDGSPLRVDGLILDITEQVAAERQLKTYVDTIADMMVVLGRDGDIRAVNHATCAMTGCSETDLIGSDWIARFVPEPGRAEARAALDAAMSRPDPAGMISFGNATVVRDGELRLIEWRYSRTESPDGGAPILVAFGTDRTAQRSAEEAYRSLAQFPDQNPDPVLRIDRHGDVLMANPAARKLMDELMADDRPGNYEAALRAWRGLIEQSRIARDRLEKQFSVGERVYAFVIVPVSGQEYVNLYGQDVTDRLELQSRLVDLSDNLPGVVFQYVLRPDGTDLVRYVSAGARIVWGLEPSEAERHPEKPWSIVHPDDLEDLKASINASADNLTQWQCDWRVSDEAGTEKWLRGRGRPYREADGSTVWNSLILDITEERKASEDLKHALAKTIGALSAALEARDPYTAGHENSVARLCVKIGRKLGLDSEQVDGLELAALVHDVGKIRVPAEILAKPSRLSPVEYALIKEHPVTGAEILKDIDSKWPIADIVRQHHERMNGSGYPDGLAGDEILLEARIMAVADTVDAMAAHRPYRPALGLDRAVAEVKAGRGSLYDPAVVDAFLELLDAGDIAFMAKDQHVQY